MAPLEKEGAEVRAERLRVLLDIATEEPSLRPSELLERGLVDLLPSEHALLGDLTDEDHELADACLVVGRALRARDWAKLEALLSNCEPLFRTDSDQTKETLGIWAEDFGPAV